MKKTLSLKTAETEKSSHLDYFKIAISIDCVIFGYENKDLKVLLIKSDLKEYAGLYSLLGDLIRPDEDLDEASYRILKERTSMDDVYLQQVHAFGSVERHPSGRVITISYYSLIDIKSHKLQLSHNDLHWHSVKDIKELAFDHKLILDMCLDKLRDQILEHPVVFNLLPERFSLREVQELYEAILDTPLDRRNFRKKIAQKNWLIDLDQMEDRVPHRPGKLYQVKPSLQKKSREQMEILIA